MGIMLEARFVLLLFVVVVRKPVKVTWLANPGVSTWKGSVLWSASGSDRTQCVEKKENRQNEQRGGTRFVSSLALKVTA